MGTLLILQRACHLGHNDNSYDDVDDDDEHYEDDHDEHYEDEDEETFW